MKRAHQDWFDCKRESKSENDFDLHENETACRTHFRKKGFTLKLVLTRAQENSEMAY